MEPSSASEAAVELPAAPPEAPVDDALPLLLHLHAEGDWQGLRTEALKAGYLMGPEGLHAPEFAYMAALGSLELGQTEIALQELSLVRSQWPDSPTAELATLAIASARMDQAPRLGASLYVDYLDRYPSGDWRELAATRAAWGMAHDGYFSMALSQLDNAGVPVSDPLRLSLSEPPQWKRPMVATFLSGALPGAGQLYAGQPKEAASAFFVNAVFLTGMVVAARQEAWPSFGVIAFFGLGFYTGNIYGAADAAIRHNRAVRDEILEAMEAEYPEATPLPAVED